MRRSFSTRTAMRTATMRAATMRTQSLNAQQPCHQLCATPTLEWCSPAHRWPAEPKCNRVHHPLGLYCYAAPGIRSLAPPSTRPLTAHAPAAPHLLHATCGSTQRPSLATRLCLAEKHAQALVFGDLRTKSASSRRYVERADTGTVANSSMRRALVFGDLQ